MTGKIMPVLVLVCRRESWAQTIAVGCTVDTTGPTVELHPSSCSTGLYGTCPTAISSVGNTEAEVGKISALGWNLIPVWSRRLKGDLLPILALMLLQEAVKAIPGEGLSCQ